MSTNPPFRTEVRPVERSAPSSAAYQTGPTRGGRVNWRRALLAAVAGFVVFASAMTLLFGNPVVERLLYTEAAGQSPKVLAMFFDVPPRPAVFWVWSDVGAVGARGAAVDAMLLVWMLALTVLYAGTWAGRSQSAWRSGLAFGAAMWAVVFLLFETLVPFNVLWEPFRLVALELALQLVAMLITGLAIALTYGARVDHGRS